MAPKYHPTPLSGGDQKALSKKIAKSRAMTGILAVETISKPSRSDEGGLKSLSVHGERTESVSLQSDNRK
jgi:hypothetical protein